MDVGGNRRICLHLLGRSIMLSGHQCRFPREPVREGFEPSVRLKRRCDARLPMKLSSLVVDVKGVLLLVLLLLWPRFIDIRTPGFGIAASMLLVSATCFVDP